jgi:hypothetical protein
VKGEGRRMERRVKGYKKKSGGTGKKSRIRKKEIKRKIKKKRKKEKRQICVIWNGNRK